MARITLITLLKQDDLNKITTLLRNIKICKVPYGINDENRLKIDNLPFHFTLFATDKKNESELLSMIQNIKSDCFKLKINQVGIMPGRNHSSVLYFGIEENKELKELQRYFYAYFHEEKYNPETFLFHMTIHIDQDYKVVQEIYKTVMKSFKPFVLEVSSLALFNYPGEIIQKFELEKK